MPPSLLDLLSALEARHGALCAEVEVLKTGLADSEATPGFRAVFHAVAEAMQFHVDREERFLFGGIRELVAGDGDAESVRQMLDTMSAEHLELAALQLRLLERIDEGGALSARIVAFVDAYEAHNRAEDEYLVPRVEQLLAGPPS